MRSTGPSRTVCEYRSIDGNWIRAPKAMGFCTYHRGYLTEKQVKLHGCRTRHKGICARLRDMEGRSERMNAEQRLQSVLDKILHKLTNIDMNVSRIEKELKKHRDESKCKEGVCNQRTEDDLK